MINISLVEYEGIETNRFQKNSYNKIDLVSGGLDMPFATNAQGYSTTEYSKIFTPTCAEYFRSATDGRTQRHSTGQATAHPDEIPFQ